MSKSVLESLWGRLCSLWPALPFLALGPCVAWMALMRSGVWMSSVEVNSDAVKSLSLTVDFTIAAALLVVLLARKGAARILPPRLFAAVAGVLGAMGSLLIVMTGPYYGPIVFSALDNPKWLLTVSGILCGASIGMLYLQVGIRYCILPFRYAILYLCYSNVLGVVIYLAVMAAPTWAIVQGGPTLSVIISFSLLPMCASALLAPRFNPALWAACCSPSDVSKLEKTSRFAGLESQMPSRSFLRMYGRLLIVLTLFSLVCAGVTINIVCNAKPAMLQSQYNLFMLLRLPVLLVVAVGVVSVDAERINFAKLCLAAIVVLEACVVVASVLDPNNEAWFDTVQLVGFVFELLIWSLVFAVGGTHKPSSCIIVALGFGLFALGNAAGSVLGMGLGAVETFLSINLLFAVVLLPTFLLVGERDLDELIAFDSDTSAPESLGQALGGKIAAKQIRVRGGFASKLDAYARVHQLTARESETLRYLAAGRGDNQIAEAMGVSYNTARTHVRNVYAKCGVHGRQELIDVVDRLV